jgi:ubiquinone/menaquinone biosynthesis C-methylase UbiE
VHPTLGILAKSQAFFYALAFFWLDGFAVPAPAQVTQAVRRFLEYQFKFRSILMDKENSSQDVENQQIESRWGSGSEAQNLIRRAERLWNLDYLERVVLPLLNISPNSRVLDVGCGFGGLTLLLAKLCPSVQFVGIDLEPECINGAKSSAAKLNLTNVDFQEGDAANMPFEPNSFDGIVCQTLLIHVSDASKVVGEMARVLRPGAMLMVADWNERALWLNFDNLADDLQGLSWYDQWFHLTKLYSKGRQILGRGDDKAGTRVASMALEAGLETTEIRINDRTQYLIPPYRSASERSILEEYQEWFAQEKMDDGDRKWFTENILAGGGTQDEANAYIALVEGNEFKQTIRELHIPVKSHTESGACRTARGRKSAVVGIVP